MILFKELDIFLPNHKSFISSLSLRKIQLQRRLVGEDFSKYVRGSQSTYFLEHMEGVRTLTITTNKVFLFYKSSGSQWNEKGSIMM